MTEGELLVGRFIVYEDHVSYICNIIDLTNLDYKSY